MAAFAANKLWAYWAVSGVVLGAAYLLWLYQRVFWGKITNEENEHLKDMNGRELATLVPLVVLCFWIGIYPKPVLDFLHKPAARDRGGHPAGEVRPEGAGSRRRPRVRSSRSSSRGILEGGRTARLVASFLVLGGLRPPRPPS